MASPLEKTAYLLHLAQKHRISVELLNQVLMGEDNLPCEQRLDILSDVVSEEDEMFFSVIWKGNTFPYAIKNVPYSDFVGRVVDGLNLTLHGSGYRSQLFFANTRIADEAFFQQIIRNRHACGIVNIISNNIQNLQKVCNDFQRPYLLINRPNDADTTNAYYFSMNSREATKDVVRHLYGLGHRRIANIHGFLSQQTGYNRLTAYQEIMCEKGILDAAYVIGANWQEAGGYHAAQQLLANPIPPTAIIAANDRMAIGALQAIQEKGLRIPQDISLVGYDDLSIALTAEPKLSTVRLPMTSIGQEAAHYILALLHGLHPEPRQRLFPVELIIRESTGPAPSDPGKKNPETNLKQVQPILEL
ncbi:hypothetical protein MASR2M15_17800 [Anaerolineales bacterium]